MHSIEMHNIDTFSPALAGRFLLELLHEQLPLPVPCYDLVLVIELTLGPHKAELWVLPTPLT